MGTPLLVHYIQYGRAEGRVARAERAADPGRDAGAAADVALVEASGLFDAQSYAGAAEAARLGIGPVEHYLRLGEAAGLTPSDGFDPVHYVARNPDLAGMGTPLLVHYIKHGRAEGRRPLSFAASLDLSSLSLDPGRPTILIAVHDGSRTGAPILAWNLARALAERYEVVVLLKRGGPMEAHFEGPRMRLLRCFAPGIHLDEIEMSAVADALCARAAFAYAIVNSVEARDFVPTLERNGVPVLALVHEFSAYTRPQGALWKAYSMASEVVFSSRITLGSSLADYPPLGRRPVRVIPQGPCAVPAEGGDADGAASGQRRGAPVIGPRTFLVIGLGSVHIRKGVDLLIATAAEVRRAAPEADIRFLWIGGGYDPARELNYSVYLKEQLACSGFDEGMILDEVDDLEPYYARAQLLLLSARLDPLPNVAIDAMLRGLPVVAFENASGIADILADDPETAELVVPHLSTAAAAQMVLRLHGDPERLAQLGDAGRRIARATFNMPGYVETLDAMGRAARGRMDRALAGETAILEADVLNRDLLLRPDDGDLSPGAAVRRYLTASKNFAPWTHPGSGDWLRRPMAGFHPLVYAAEGPFFDGSAGQDPLVHFLEAGRPKGRWSHPVIGPDALDAPLATPLAGVALHAHFHYPDLLADLLRKLAANETRCDLFLTATDASTADALRAILAEHGAKAAVSVVPNRGRDIGPFVTRLLPDLARRYAVVGHVHGKRSLRLGAEAGERWREFLWQHLVGDAHPMMDRVLSAFARDPRLGLVFPLDPHLIDWGENRDIAAGLATRMGITSALPTHFEFPIGTMFWARADALRPLLNLGLGWDDYPEEPLDEDGTVLHALERLLPFVAAEADYTFATTHVPGSRR
jgi:glycosyltransferase involved in cell wall biosynthesis